MSNPDVAELEFWEGSGGTDYAARNTPTSKDVEKRAEALQRVWSCMPTPPETILEVGSGPGANLAALRRITSARLYAVEPCEAARAMSSAHATVYDGHAGAIPTADESFDLVMTAGVLIHVHPDRLRLAQVEIARVSRRYVLAVEYFASEVEAVRYYGADRIWKNDFGRRYVEDVGLRHVAHGFFWRPETAFDNVVWWLLERPEKWTPPTSGVGP